MKSSHTPGHMTIGELRKGACSEALRREAFDAIIKRISDETSIPVLLGTFT